MKIYNHRTSNRLQQEVKDVLSGDTEVTANTLEELQYAEQVSAIHHFESNVPF